MMRRAISFASNFAQQLAKEEVYDSVLDTPPPRTGSPSVGGGTAKLLRRAVTLQNPPPLAAPSIQWGDRQCVVLATRPRADAGLAPPTGAPPYPPPVFASTKPAPAPPRHVTL